MRFNQFAALPRRLAALLCIPGAALAGPDLTVTEVDAGSVVTDSQALTISGTLQVGIRNIGDAAAGPLEVLAFEDRDGNGLFDAGDVALGSGLQAGGLAPGAAAEVPVPVSGTVLFAGNLIYAFADSAGAIAEDDETNNLRHSGESSQFVPTPGPFSPVLEWHWGAGSTLDLPDELNIMMTPSVIDLTGDGVPEVVFGATSNTSGSAVIPGFLRVLDGADGSEVFAVSNPDHLVNTATTLATGDIDGDGLPEIVAARSSGDQLIAFEHDGTFKWLSDFVQSTQWGAVTLADLNGDGTPEILIGREALDNAGNLLWTGTGNVGSSAGGMSLVADVDLDGAPEVVAGAHVYSNTGAIERTLAGGGEGPNAVANFDDDDFAEIVTVSNGRVFLHNHDGTLVWGPVSIPGGGVGGPPTVADYDSDGEPEIGVAGAIRYAVLETDGNLKWAAVTQDGSSNRTGSSVFDFDGDGSAEVVYRDELRLRVYEGATGTVLFDTPMSSCTWHEYINVADVDADGNAEIVAVANNNCGFGPQRGVYVFGDANDNWVPTRRIWNQHTYHITNVNADGTIPAVEQNNWLVGNLNNYRLNEFLPGEGTSADAPDLVPSFIRFDQEFCPETVTLTARVGNGGSLLAPAGVHVSFYHGDPAAGGVLIGTVQTSAGLHPGQFEDVSLAWNLPPAGLQEVHVVADDDGSGSGAVNEGREDNNAAGATEVLCAPECIENLEARAKSGKIQLTWTHVTGSIYDVLRAEAAGGPFATIGTTDSTWSTWLDDTVVNDVPYWYRIRRMPGDFGMDSCLSDPLEAMATARRLRR